MADGFWTQADIDALKKAVASGILTVEFTGPPARKRTYQSLAEMRALLAEMREDVATANGGSSYQLASFKKGF